jgi:antitoxin HigA-1
MSIPNSTGMKRKPTHPGEMLREDFLPDYDLSVAGLAEVLRVSRQSINELLRERRAVSREMAQSARYLPTHCDAARGLTRC